MIQSLLELEVAELNDAVLHLQIHPQRCQPGTGRVGISASAAHQAQCSSTQIDELPFS